MSFKNSYQATETQLIGKADKSIYQSCNTEAFKMTEGAGCVYKKAVHDSNQKNSKGITFLSSEYYLPIIII